MASILNASIQYIFNLLWVVVLVGWRLGEWTWFWRFRRLFPSPSPFVTSQEDGAPLTNHGNMRTDDDNKDDGNDDDDDADKSNDEDDDDNDEDADDDDDNDNDDEDDDDVKVNDDGVPNLCQGDDKTMKKEQGREVKR